MNKKILSLVIVLIVIVILVLSLGKKTKDDGIFKIGYIGPETGPSAVLGMDAIPAITIAVEEINKKGGINGKPVELVVEDDQYLTKNTINAYNKLVNVDKVDALLVATYGGVFSIKDQAEKDDVIVIDPLDCNSELAGSSDNIFCLATETESIGVSIAEYMIKNGQTNAAVMYSTKDSFMNLVSKAFEDKFVAEGGKIVAKEAFNFEDNDFRTHLLKVKGSSPTGLVILGHDEQGLIMKQARELGIQAPFYTTGTITSPVAQKSANGYAEGTYFAYWDASADNKLSKEFDTKFIEKVGRPAILPLTTHPAYDTMQVLFNVFEQIEGDVTSNKIAKGLLNTQNFEGTTGTISFEKDGGARIKESIFKLVNGAPVKVN
jgi:branched-chain amino acid transport system substrate-binding protein